MGEIASTIPCLLNSNYKHTIDWKMLSRFDKLNVTHMNQSQLLDKWTFPAELGKKNKLCRKGPRGYDFTYTPHQIFAITKSLWTAPSSRIAVGFVVKERIISPWLSKIASSKEVKPLIRTLPTTSNIQISSPNIMTTKRQIAIRVNIVSDLRLIWGWLLLLNKQQTT